MDDEQTTQQAHGDFVAAVLSRIGPLFVVSVSLIALSLVLAPLAYIDAVNAAGPSLDKRPVLGALLRLPVRVLGLLSLALGSCVLVWIPYNIFVERSEHFTGGWESLLALSEWLAVVGIGWWWLRGARGQRPKH